MKQVKVRDFQRDFYKIKGELLEVFNGDGEKVGTWLPNNGLSNSDGQGFGELTGKLEKQEAQSEDNGLGNSDGHTEDEGAEINQCNKCGKNSSDSYEVWEDGDEYIICSSCVKVGIPPKMLKGYLAKLKKL